VHPTALGARLDRKDSTTIIVRPFPEFVGKDRYLLLRHLATSPRWCLKRFEDHWFAERRFYFNVDWYDRVDWPDLAWETICPRVALCVYLTFGTDELPNNDISPKYMTTSVTKVSALTAGNYQVTTQEWGNDYNSDLVLAATDYYLTINERGYSPARLITQAAVDAVHAELEALKKSSMANTRGFDPSLMPTAAIRTGQPEMQIWPGKDFYGYYYVSAFVNPGELGHVYVKTFSDRYNVPLTVDRELQALTNPRKWPEITGWSINPQQLFYYQTLVWIDEGGLQYSYPVRFELWFKPDNPQHHERKLVERVYRVSGGGY